MITDAEGRLDVDRTRAARDILLEAALLGVLADGAIRQAPGGLGWTIWVIGLSLAATNIARRREVGITSEQVAWLGLAVACSAAFAWRNAEELQVVNIFGTLVALTMYAMSAAGLPAASVFVARVRDVVTAGIYTLRDIVAGLPMLVFGEASLQSLPAVRRGASWTVLRAVLLTAPIVLVFTALLSRADPMFASVFRLPTIDAERVFAHVVVTGAFAWWSAGWMRGALLGVAARPSLPDRLPVRLGLGEITTSLGAVATLFAIFVAMQLRWLFGGAEVVLATTGLTAAEYARRGFFELVAVTALVLPLILVTRALVEDPKVERRHRILSLVLIVLLLPIIASALMRMQLYIENFGLSTDRLYATAFIAWLGVVSIAMARTVLRGWARPFAAMTLLSGFATLLVVNVANPDVMVARVNLGRSDVRAVDYVYLAKLSGDAMPLVVNALTTATPSPGSCEAAELVRARWQGQTATSWNLGARRGTDAVRGLSESEVRRLCATVPTP